MNRNPAGLLFVILSLILISGCSKTEPDYRAREAAGEVPVIEMGSPEETREAEPLDIGALLSDLHSQVKTLEEGINGTDPALKESLAPLDQSISDLRNMLEQSGPSVDKACTAIKEIQDEMETIRQGL